MNLSITQSQGKTAELRIMKDLLDAFLAEQFFIIDAGTVTELSAAPELIQKLYPAYGQASVYIGEICFLIETCYKQGFQWVAGSPIYKKSNPDWVEVASPAELGEVVLRCTLSDEAYAHPGVADFLEGLKVSVQQLSMTLEETGSRFARKPESAYDWFVKGEMIASLRDRPFHPSSKAKIGFAPQDYRTYMA